MYKKKVAALLGHIIRCKSDDPLREATFFGDSLRKKELDIKRVGHPKLCWTTLAFKLAWEKIKDAVGKSETRFDETNTEIMRDSCKETLFLRSHPQKGCERASLPNEGVIM